MAKGGAGLTKPAVALTHRAIEAMKPGSAPYRVPDSRCAGLAVRVAINGVRTFDLAFRIKGGRSVRTSLGKFTDVGLDAARDRANELTKAARAGVDLLAAEKDAAADKASRLTIAELIERYCKKQVRGKLRSARELESRLKRALAPKLDTPAEEIKRRDLRDLFDEAADAGFQREAEKRRQTVGAMFRWALSQDYLSADPTAGLKAYDAGSPRDRVLSNKEVRTLWEWLDADTIPAAHVDAPQGATRHRRALRRSRGHDGRGSRLDGMGLDAPRRALKERTRENYASRRHCARDRGAAVAEGRSCLRLGNRNAVDRLPCRANSP